MVRRHKSRKARIEAPKREAQSSPAAHRGARVIGADALRIVLISPDPSDGQECNQDNEGNPNINAHQSSPAGDLSKQVEPALFFDAKLDLAAPYASGNASIASLANSIASSFEYLAEDVRSLLDSLPAMFWPSKRLKYANHLPG